MISVFTPTYNRKKLLNRLYISLENQTDKNFEWIIVDDGSIDDTKKYIDTIKKKSSFKIIYFYKENGGKPSAHNKALEICKNDYFMIVDSDDFLSKDAIEILNKKIPIIDKNEHVSGIFGLKGMIDENGTIKPIGTNLPKIDYSTGIDLYQKYGFKGDSLRLYKTKVLKEYPFPLIKNEKFIPENVVFDQIDLKYKMLVIPEILYYCEYQNDGLSNNISKIRINNPIGYSLSLKSTAETARTVKKKIGLTCLYIIWCRKFKINSFKIFKKKHIYVLSYPLSIAMNLLKKPRFFFKMFD